MQWPADQVERRPLAVLIPSAHNARTHSDAQVAQIVASIREWGWTMPVLIDEAGTIIAGHGRVLAAARLDLHEVPVMVARGWSDAQKRAYLIADNKLGLNAGWNEELLRIEMADLMTMGFELPLMGFSERELSALNASGNPGLTDPDAAPDAPAVPVTRPGDVWTLGRHRLLCGDATSKTDVVMYLGGVRPHLMVTDPPYGVAYDPKWRAYADVNKNRGKLGAVANDDRADWREAWALFLGDVAYCWHAGKHASTVQASLEAAGFEVRAQIVWAKDRFALSRGDYHWQHELCWYTVRKGAGGHWLGDRSQTTLWHIPAREDSGHGHLTLQYVDWLALQLLPDTAETEWLDRHGQIWLVNADGSKGRKLATLATGTASFQGIIDGTVVPTGTQLQSAIPMPAGSGSPNVAVTFETLEDVVTPSGAPVDGLIRALDPGSFGNLPDDTSLAIYPPIDGVDSAAIVRGMIGGADTETDDQLRARILQRIQNPPMGGSAADYVAWALAVPGVTRAWAAPEQGPGTITVRFLMDDLRADDDGWPTPADIETVALYIDQKRPVMVMDCYVLAPIKQFIDITIANLVPGTSEAQAEIEASLQAMLLQMAAPGQTIYAAWVSFAIMSSPSVQSFQLLTTDDYIMPSLGHMAVVGTILYQ